MKELRNNAGDLAMVVKANTPWANMYIGQTVTCVVLHCATNMWTVNDRKGKRIDLAFYDNELLPLGGENVLADEPQPKLTQGSEIETEIEKEEPCQ